MDALTAMKQALEALDKCCTSSDRQATYEEAKANLRATMAQLSAAKPVVWWNPKYPTLTVQLTKPNDRGGWEPLYAVSSAPTIEGGY